jgi:hypothetical protein
MELTDAEIAVVTGGGITVAVNQSNTETVTQTGTVIGGPPVVNISKIFQTKIIDFGSPPLGPPGA